MSSTAGVQNLLVNVFRPVYVYDPLTTLFTPKLEISNIDNYSGNTVSVFTAAVGDANSNVYVGSNAGNLYTALRSCSNVTAIGYSAGNGISNVSNSTYLGLSAGAGAVDANAVIGIGATAGGNGTSNIFIGNGTSATGNSNILIGHGITATSNTLRLGSTVYGDLSTKWIGIGASSPGDSNNKFDVSGNTYIYGQVGINAVPGTRTLYVNGNFGASDGLGNTLDFNGGITLSSGGLGSVTGSRAVGVGTATVGTIKVGVIVISAVDVANSANYASRMVLAYSTSNVTDIGSNVTGGTAQIEFTSSNIVISNTTTVKTYKYSITYFPLI